MICGSLINTTVQKKKLQKRREPPNDSKIELICPFQTVVHCFGLTNFTPQIHLSHKEHHGIADENFPSEIFYKQQMLDVNDIDIKS